MAIIEVEELTKSFQLARKQPGIMGSMRRLIKPAFETITAVDQISFSVDKGETLAFIGPNGAGKSTTIKMLTGILHPSSGVARVAGLVPWQQRQNLASKIGCVFGQRSQLWYHLPAIDSFHVLGRIYDLPDQHVQRRIKTLTELFELDEFINTPVRKLSLGQRMRCEIATCLLHEPEILFLDEPTIGLDVVAKRTIRELILKLNKEEKTTIFLTSHDAEDIARLCRRVIIINHGGLVLDLPVKELKHRYMMQKIVGVRFEESPQVLPQIEGIELIKRKKAGMKFLVDTQKLGIGKALALIADAGQVADITVSDPPLEQIIADIYQTEKEEDDC
jgi:ABC-2 type transport system ATP-binding protein